ncbi:MAG: hypothetical protein RBS91_00175 [Sulfurimonadaceae bacterium]|nr:hypothetical protein [Sulfurimonadaceae bacterium]
MNRSLFALFVAVLIHLLLAMFIWIATLISPKKDKPIEEERVKVSLKEYVPQKKPEPIVEPKTKPTQEPIEAPPMPKGSQLKELTPKPIKPEKPIKYEEKKTPPKKPTLNKPKEITPKIEPKPKFEPLPSQKPMVELKPEKPKDEYSFLGDFIPDTKQKQESKSSSGGNITSDIRDLYGDEFGKLSSEQQKYILDNQEIMRRITQEVLNRVADVNLRGTNLSKNSVNIIEFYLHPNGDMSDFKFLTKSGYYELDRTTQETIEFAYARYPRPKEKTLIRYNVYYRFY